MKTFETQAVLNMSAAAGFDDACIVPCADMPKKDAPFKTESILVLFSRYRPAAQSEKGRIRVSAYYVASNEAYAKAGALADALCAIGIPALRDSALPAQSTALLAGGSIGRNGFYYHPVFGSLVHIQTVRLGIKAEGNGPLKPGNVCRDCGACMRACPTGAVGDGGVDVSKCLRSRMDKGVPDEMKPFIYQLLGCEKCQSACPINRNAGTAADFDLAATVRGETLGDLKALVGSNMARLVRIVNQAVIVAANQNYGDISPDVDAIAKDERFADACRYYLEKTGRAGGKKD